MPLPSSSATSVGGGRSSGKSFSPRSGGGGGGGATVRQRRATPTARAKSSTSTGNAGSTMWRFYNEDSPGLKVGPVPVLVMSLLFIASVFMLHIWGKYTRS